MAFSFYDSTGDSTTTVGTGSLVGTQTPPVGYQSPITAGVTDGAQTIIRIENSFGDVWEVCETTITIVSGVLTYSRGTVVASSAGGSRVSFAAGIKSIFYTVDSAHLGGAGGVSSIVASEKPTGTIDGSNSTFVTANPFVPGTLSVMVNGIELSTPEEYFTTGTNTVVLTNSPIVGDRVLVNYAQL